MDELLATLLDHLYGYEQELQSLRDLNRWNGPMMDHRGTAFVEKMSQGIAEDLGLVNAFLANKTVTTSEPDVPMPPPAPEKMHE